MIEVDSEPAPYSAPLYSVPSILDQLKYLSSLLTSLLRKYFERKIVGKKPQWTVKYINQAWTKSDFRKGVLLGEKNRYLADPFLAIHDGNVSCFVEDAGFNRKKGVISVYSLESTGFVRKGECINEAFHLSYPFVFNFQNTFIWFLNQA